MVEQLRYSGGGNQRSLVQSVDPLMSSLIKKYYAKGKGKQISKDEYRDVMRVLTIVQSDALPVMGRQDAAQIANLAETASYFNFPST